MAPPGEQTVKFGLNLKEAILIKLSVFVAMSVLTASVAMAAGADAIKERRELMKTNGEATKPIVAMMKGAPFDLAAVQTAL